jgi:molybdopterin molybdotransferase
MPLADAWARLQQAALAYPKGTFERVDSVDALGRVLAEAVVSEVDVPPLDNSAMDGYAVVAADLPATLAVSQRVAAGDVPQVMRPGTCVRIFTGAALPAGADAVVMQEQATVCADGQVRFDQAVKPGQNIRRRGEDIASGQVVLHAGVRLQAAHLGVAASVGRADLQVFEKPRVAVLTTGNELVMPGQPLPPGGIYNSNRHTLRGLLHTAGVHASDLGVVPDKLEATRSALREAAMHHDLILTSGGVSVGEEDHLRAAVQAEGQLDFWALGIKPGKPFVFGQVRRPDGSACLYMGLPGNPVASFVTCTLLALPVLRVLAGQAWRLPAGYQVAAAFDWPKADKRREFLRARINAEGRAELYPHQGSGVLMSAAWADGLIDLAPLQTVVPGQPVTYIPWADWWQP